MRVLPLLAVLTLASAPALSAQSTSYTCKNGRVVANASACTMRTAKAKKHRHKKHHRRTTSTSYGTVESSVHSSAVVQTPAKPSVPQKVSHGVGEAGGDVSKLAKKAGHGIKEAASDVKKAVTGKP